MEGISYPNANFYTFARRKDLDDLGEEDCYQTFSFSVTLNVEFSKSVQSCRAPWQNHSFNAYSYSLLFTSKLEADEMTDSYGN